MKFFKTHLSLILSLLFMMFAFEFILITNATLKHYEELVNKDYNIIVVSKTELDQNVVKTKIINNKNKFCKLLKKSSKNLKIYKG